MVASVDKLPSQLMNRSVNGKVTRIGFLLLDNFTMIALASAVDTLRMANQLSGKELYSWHVLSESGDNVTASDGLSFNAEYSISNAPEFDLVVVCGGVDITRSYSVRQLQWLRTNDRKGVTIGAICTGAFVLAKAGLMDGYGCSAHWECMAALQENFPKVHINKRLFTFDKNRLTSSGGTAPMDMFLNLIALQFGGRLSSAISDMFICERVRSDDEQQRVPLRQVQVVGESKSRLVDVIEIMENNIEEPVDLDELATIVCISRRQLERMFHKYMNCSPSRFYLKLRLDRAKQLLKQSNMSIVEIAAACGFVSTPHFSRCYRKHIGLSPRDERRMHWNATVMASSPRVTSQFSSPSQDSVSRSALSHAQAEPTFGSIAI